MSDEPHRGSGAPPLEELCQVLGVQSTYRSGGDVHRADPETLTAALRALGAPIEHPDDAAEALRAVRVTHLRRPCPPTTVSWTDQTPSLPVCLPREGTSGALEVDLYLEDGSHAARQAGPTEIRWTEEWTVDGRRYRGGLLPLPRGLPTGYHTVRVRGGGTEGRGSLIRAPRTAWTPEPARRWGTFLPLHALRSRRSRGAGDLADLRELARWTAGRGGDLVGTLPLYDTFLGPGEPFDPSPYAPVSRLFWNPLWVALDEAPGLDAAPEARRRLQDGDARARELRDGDVVDYRRAMAHTRRILEAVIEAHRGDGPHGLDRRLTRWVEDDPEALAYARFRAAVESRSDPWTRWEGRARGGDDEALDVPDRAVRYHVYAQWAVGEQLDALAGASSAAAGLYLDLPLGSHPQGFDHWRNQADFARDFTVGAPPDAFFEGGQDWGFPPLHPHRVRENGHGYWAACLRTAMSVTDALRLDHVMSLHRLFWVPRGMPASSGVYVRYPADELWAVLCLESRRARTEVVGEDLGTVPPEVPEAMERHHVRSMWVLPFEVEAGRDVNPPSPDSVASLNTHDLPTFAAFEGGVDIDARLEAGRLDDDEAHAERRARRTWGAALAALLREGGHLGDDQPDTADLLAAALAYLSSSNAGTVLVNLEDLWLETEPQNVPGTTSATNWTRKARLPLEALTSDPAVRELLDTVDRLRR